MKRYTTYIFDFDYTLVDSSRGIVTCFRHVLGNHGHTGVTDTEIKRTIGKTLEESFSILTGITEAGTLADYKREYVKAAEPAPEGLLLAIGRASGGGKSEVLYVGDSVVDAATAQAAGTDFAGVLHGMTTREELEAYPHVAIVDDLRGILPVSV